MLLHVRLRSFALPSQDAEQRPMSGEHSEILETGLPVECPGQHKWLLNRGWVGGSSVWILDKLTDDFAFQFGFLPFFFGNRILRHSCTRIEEGMGLVEASRP
jgi:hypothetical protein